MKGLIGVWLVAVLIWALAVVAIIYVAAHFIAKLW